MSGIDKITGMSTQDAARWRGARTLGDLGELTAQWLEGAIGSLPGVLPGYGPDEKLCRWCQSSPPSTAPDS